MDGVAKNLEAMGQVQYLLAFLFLCSYAFALGQFIGEKGRRVAVAVAALTAIAFAVLSDPWEQGVMVVAFAVVGMGLFTGLSWLAWLLMSRREAFGGGITPSPVQPVRTPTSPRRALLSRLMARLRFI